MKTIVQTLAKLSVLAAAALAMAQAQAAVVEPFTGGQLSAAGWSTGIGADASQIGIAPAPDGTYGIALSEAQWSYNTDISFTAGQTLTAWINPGPGPVAVSGAQGGRLYIGFDADATGAYSFVAASDEGKLGFQDNTGYATPDFSVSSNYDYGDQWYLLSVALSDDGHTATAKLFDADGTTLLGTATESGLTRSATGIALRGTGAAVVTSIAVVPEPQSQVLIVGGLAAVGALARRRRA